MSYTKEVYMDECLDANGMTDQDLELLKFESWYYSVIDDVASLIVTNGYNQVMKDIIDTVARLEQKGV